MNLQALRKEWLILHKNVKRVKTPQQIQAFREAVIKWRLHYVSLISQIRPSIDERLRDERKMVDPGWAEHFREKQEPIWKFSFELSSVPDFKFLSQEMRHYLKSYKGYSDQEIEKKEVEDWRVDALKWDQRASAKARDAWKWLDEFQSWSSGFLGGREPFQWNEGVVENHTLEGFKVQVVGFTQSSINQDSIAKIKESLRLYRKAAKHRVPLLLKVQLPIKLNYFDQGRGDASASYKRDHIDVKFWGLHADKKRFVHIIAHEMGHHVYRTYLSGSAREFWERSIKGDWGSIDFREVLKKMKPHESIADFSDRIEREDPVLHIQLETLVYNHRYKDLDLYSMSTIREDISRGLLDPVLKVPKSPITGYAAKNPEEAFCEVLGLLVGYGPRTVLPEVLSRMKVILPNIKLSKQVSLDYSS